MPLGMQILDFDTKAIIIDMDKDPKCVRLLKGGKGGLGNSHFKTPQIKLQLMLKAV